MTVLLKDKPILKKAHKEYDIFTKDDYMSQLSLVQPAYRSRRVLLKAQCLFFHLLSSKNILLSPLWASTINYTKNYFLTPSS